MLRHAGRINENYLPSLQQRVSVIIYRSDFQQHFQNENESDEEYATRTGWTILEHDSGEEVWMYAAGHHESKPPVYVITEFDCEEIDGVFVVQYE